MRIREFLHSTVCGFWFNNFKLFSKFSFSTRFIVITVSPSFWSKQLYNEFSSLALSKNEYFVPRYSTEKLKFFIQSMLCYGCIWSNAIVDPFWNSLPMNLRSSSSLTEFKTNLKSIYLEQLIAYNIVSSQLAKT